VLLRTLLRAFTNLITCFYEPYYVLLRTAVDNLLFIFNWLHCG